MNNGDGSAMVSGEGDRGDFDSDGSTRQVLADHWLTDGYSMPNRATYPCQCAVDGTGTVVG